LYFSFISSINEKKKDIKLLIEGTEPKPRSVGKVANRTVSICGVYLFRKSQCVSRRHFTIVNRKVSWSSIRDSTRRKLVIFHCSFCSIHASNFLLMGRPTTKWPTYVLFFFLFYTYGYILLCMCLLYKHFTVFPTEIFFYSNLQSKLWLKGIIFNFKDDVPL
jgi:hypothetical protein